MIPQQPVEKTVDPCHRKRSGPAFHKYMLAGPDPQVVLPVPSDDTKDNLFLNLSGHQDLLISLLFILSNFICPNKKQNFFFDMILNGLSHTPTFALTNADIRDEIWPNKPSPKRHRKPKIAPAIRAVRGTEGDNKEQGQSSCPRIFSPPDVLGDKSRSPENTFGKHLFCKCERLRVETEQMIAEKNVTPKNDCITFEYNGNMEWISLILLDMTKVLITSLEQLPQA
ncbi:hypothetical protein DUI87_22888 [Hirundo rustica rustica]|uniref:Uncharacterized protein n=1 Tax=Hirundo rustica rustica TaxID=333673 RepID=A0A3M0JIX5_HIRRU|nr:hypothetical protein DUI87_22888 [Hirundo rustica rustica]